MEITMTLTVSPEKAVEIAQLLQNQTTAPQQNTAVPAASQPSPMQFPAPPNPAQNNPFAAAPQQMGVPAQQTAPGVIPHIAGGGSPLPQSAPTYSIQDLTLAARPLMEMGKQAELAQLLAEFGVQAVAMLPENRRADFAARLRAMGGQI